MIPKTKQSTKSVVREIKRKTRRKFNSEEKIRIILEGLKGEDSIANICRREGIAPSMYYKWSKAFLEAGNHHFPEPNLVHLLVNLIDIFLDSLLNEQIVFVLLVK